MGAVMRIPVRISARVEDGIPLFFSAKTGCAFAVHTSEQHQSVNPEGRSSLAIRVIELKLVMTDAGEFEARFPL